MIFTIIISAVVSLVTTFLIDIIKLYVNKHARRHSDAATLKLNAFTAIQETEKVIREIFCIARECESRDKILWRADTLLEDIILLEKNITICRLFLSKELYNEIHAFKRCAENYFMLVNIMIRPEGIDFEYEKVLRSKMESATLEFKKLDEIINEGIRLEFNL